MNDKKGVINDIILQGCSNSDILYLQGGLHNMNEVVKIHNDLTNERIGKMNAKELDLFFSICTKVRDKGSNQITITFDDLRKLGGFQKHITNAELKKELLGVNEHISFLIRIENGDDTDQVPLFNRFTTNAVSGTLKVSVREELTYILNNLADHFTRFELAELVSLDSKYAKRLYKLLKQYRSTGKYVTSKEQLYKDLDIPPKYRACDFKIRALEPALAECGKYIKGLKYDTEKGGKGGAIKSYTFTFCKEIDAEPKQTSRADQAKQSFAQNRKTSRNRFNDFEQRNDVNMDELEQMLLSN